MKEYIIKKRRAKSDIDDGSIFMDIENLFYFIIFKISFYKSLDKVM